MGCYVNYFFFYALPASGRADPNSSDGFEPLYGHMSTVEHCLLGRRTESTCISAAGGEVLRRSSYKCKINTRKLTYCIISYSFSTECYSSRFLEAVSPDPSNVYVSVRIKTTFPSGCEI